MPKEKPVAGFMYIGDEDADRYETVCQIMDRSASTDNLEIGPTFIVRFGDMAIKQVQGSDLRPWFPV